MNILEINNLHVKVAGEPILRGVDLAIAPGEVHALMGPNGSGKSTLANVLAGRPGYAIEDGEILFLGQDLTVLEPEERAHRGLFLAFQYPVEIPGVSNMEFLKGALDSLRAARDEPSLSTVDFMKRVRTLAASLELSQEFLKRGVNEGFSGGEKKRNEILQMLLLEPRLAVLDETDSGLDIDALQVVAEGVNSFRSACGDSKSARGDSTSACGDSKSACGDSTSTRGDHERGNAVLLITHYQRLLNHIVPDYVHVLTGGRIARSGDKSLALELEERGYAWLA